MGKKGTVAIVSLVWGFLFIYCYFGGVANLPQSITIANLAGAAIFLLSAAGNLSRIGR